MAIKGELLFGLDNFNKQKVLSEADTVAQLFINILFLKQGQLPSLPHIGVDIRQYLYKFKDEIDTDFIKAQIKTHCTELMPYINFDSMIIQIVEKNMDSVLFILAPVTVNGVQQTLLVGFKKQKGSNEIVFNYKITEPLI